MKIFYAVYEEHSGEIELDLVQGEIDEYAAELAALDYYREHDGWESCWPLEFTVWNSKERLQFTVELEFQPEFYATEGKP